MMRILGLVTCFVLVGAAWATSIDREDPSRFDRPRIKAPLLYLPGVSTFEPGANSIIESGRTDPWQPIPSNIVAMDLGPVTSIQDKAVSDTLINWHYGMLSSGSSTEVRASVSTGSVTELDALGSWLQYQVDMDGALPLVTLSGDETAVEGATQHLDDMVSTALIGYMPDRQEVLMPRFDYLLLQPDKFPEEYQGQAAASYGRSLSRGRPVIFLTDNPDFSRGTVWLAGGVAGVHVLRPDLPEHRQLEFWRETRAINSFPRFFRHGRFVPAAPITPRFVAAFSDGHQAYAALVSHGPVFETSLPGFRKPALDFTELWYRPYSDERIVRPRLPVAGSNSLELDVPSQAAWFVLLAGHAADEPEQTTVTLKMWNP